MQKLRPYVLPGLFVFHLVVLFVTLSTVSTENKGSQQTAVVTILSQFFLTALFAGLGTGPWALRIPSWGALAALSWLSFAFLQVIDTQGTRRSGADDMLNATLAPLIGWLVLVTLLLLLRVIPFLKWRVALQPTSPDLPSSQHSLTRGILVVVATWGGLLMMLKDSWPWSMLATEFGKRYLLSLSAIAVLVGVGALVVTVLVVSLTLTRWAEWLFYRRRWTLPVLANLVACVAIVLLLSFGGPFKTGPERLRATLWLLPALAALPLTTLLSLGMAGYRLTPRQQAEHLASESSSQEATTITEKPVGNGFPSLQRPHIAALVGVLGFFVGYVPTGSLNQVYITIHSSSIGRNDAGEITRLTPSAWATDDSLRVITGLPQLKQLTLGNAEITDAGLVHLKRLTNLEMLSLHQSQITDAGLVHLKGITNLQTLKIWDSTITDAGMEHLKGLANLQTLKIWDSTITDAGMEHLKGLTNLESLYLTGTQITDAGLVHLAGMNLKELSMPKEAKTDLGLKHYLAAIEPPTYLDFEDWGITDAGLVHLKGLTNLESLYLTGTQITDAGLVHLKRLTNLESLDLGGTKITDAGLVLLRGMNLNSLSMPKEAKTDLGLKHYLAAIEPPTYLNFEDWGITDAGLVHLKRLTNLQSLDLGGTKITDAGLVDLKGITNLLQLDLDETQITDAGLVHLKRLTNLESLYLGGTKITDAGLVYLKGLTNLERLSLDGTPITDAGVAELKQALPNCKIEK